MHLLIVEFDSHSKHLSDLKQELHKRFGVAVSAHHSLMHSDAFIPQKRKWDAEKILNQLQSEFSSTREGKFMVLALVPYDIFADALNFVFGLGERGGNFAVISYFRLDPALGNMKDEKLFRERIVKEAVHEVGHMMGLEHCRNKRCVMTFSPNLLFVDKKTPEFCERCKFLL
ncbi:MAG: archaemetzincin family Zn-dependent metalloprotease [Candidatus Micrarchaeota archaeon]